MKEEQQDSDRLFEWEEGMWEKLKGLTVAECDRVVKSGDGVHIAMACALILTFAVGMFYTFKSVFAYIPPAFFETLIPLYIALGVSLVIIAIGVFTGDKVMNKELEKLRLEKVLKGEEIQKWNGK